MYEEILDQKESDWYQRIMEVFEDIMQIVNTKILYLIYR